MNRDQTLRALKAAGTEQNRTVYRRHGVTNEMFEVSSGQGSEFPNCSSREHSRTFLGQS